MQLYLPKIPQYFPKILLYLPEIPRYWPKIQPYLPTIQPYFCKIQQYLPKLSLYLPKRPTYLPQEKEKNVVLYEEIGSSLDVLWHVLLLLHLNFSFISGLTSWYVRGDLKSIYPKLALSGGKNECAVTGTVIFSISQVCTRGLTLKIISKILFQK